MKAGSKLLGDRRTEFAVWAPLKETMTLHIVHPFDKKMEMIKDELGYFYSKAEVGAGCLYFFMPEGEKDIPDPASQFQPQGVQGPSEVIDHSAYHWHDTNWKGLPFSEFILYEIHTGTFTEKGTFEAIIDKLDYLVATGINAIELMPVAQFPGNRNWGYDGVYYYAVQDSYGGPASLKKLVDACHQKGIAVFLDVVYNHLGPEGNYLEEFAPYFTDHYKTPWGKAINFDGQWSDGVREFFSGNAIYWFEYFHIDGLRFDAIHEVYDMGAVHFWEFLHEKIRSVGQKLGRPLYTIAESDHNSPRAIKPPELGGFGFTALWLDDFHHALYTLLDEDGKKFYVDFGEIKQLAKAYKDGFVLSNEYVKFRKRKYGASSAGISGDKFISYIDNHDQAGNRATGNCLASLISFEKLKIAAAANILSPYIPMLFMGEEYGDDAPFLYFISHSDNELIEAVRQGRKKDFEQFDWNVDSPDPYEEKTFSDSKLRWSELNDKKHTLLHQWYRELIHIRKIHPALQSFNKNDVWVNTIDELLQLHRRSACGMKEMVCVFNFSETTSFCYTISSIHSDWYKIIDSNDEQWILNEVKYKPLPATIVTGEKIMAPPLTVLVYGNADQ